MSKGWPGAASAQADKAARDFMAGGEGNLRTGCKLNLYLEITGRLPGGYHSLRTFFLPLPPGPPGSVGEGPFDRLRFLPGRAPGLEVRCAESWFEPQNNTLQKAYALYAARAKHPLPPLKIELSKGVPQGAGLGGGSANAAAVLLFLENWSAVSGLPLLGRETLLQLAAQVGADVPCFVLNRPAWASGIGDLLTPAPAPFSGFHLVLVCPDVQVSTAWAYRAWDEAQERAAGAPEPGEKILADFWANLPTSGLTRRGTRDSNDSSAAPDPAARFTLSPDKLFNSFERVVFARFPALAEIKRQLLELGAAGALMSGSGSSIFGLFSRAEDAANAAGSLKIPGRVYTRPIHAGASPSW